MAMHDGTGSSELCTDFCERLRTLQLEDRKLPSHDDLLLLLPSTDDCQQTEATLGSWRDLQERKCGFCQLAVNSIRNSVAVSQIDLDQIISVALFPGERSFRLSYPSRLGLRLAIIAEDATKSSGPDNARIVRSGACDLDDIDGWLQKCDGNHDECLAKLKVPQNGKDSETGKSFNFRESSTSNFRVLDLESMCITPISLGVKYVTLSYVWGQTNRFSLDRSNFERLRVSGSLENIRNALPKTINDAIDFVISLKIRYLWIDALCLIQDDEADVSLGISIMNSIYSGSYFTLVAASGKDADSGLYGERKLQYLQRIGELRMTYLHSIDWHLKRSVYGERGWTLQELVLPRRTVISINGQFYFRCREANWCEETWADNHSKWLDPDDSNITRIPDPHEGLLPSLWAYQKIIEAYSGRAIRYDGDAIRAVAGVTRPLSAGMATPMIEGLPGYYLDHFLLFVSSKGNLRRRPQFASFSWAGWQGSIMWTRENYNWYTPQQDWKITNIVLHLKNHSLLDWHAFSRSSTSESLSEVSWLDDSPLLTLVKEHPTTFNSLERNPEQDYRDRGWYGDSSSSSDIPWWKYKFDEKFNQVPLSNEEAIEKASHPKAGFSVKKMDLLNAQHEFDRVVANITDVRELLSLRNWQAMRSMRVRDSTMTLFGPRSRKRLRHDWYGVRGLQHTGKKEETRNRWAQEQQQKHAQGTFEIPTFPSYKVLQFVTISVHLTLGTGAPRSHDAASSPFDRVPGIPLQQDDQIVGSLHPDNLDMMAPPGSKIELIVIARSNTPTVGSALTTDHKHEAKLLWMLHVVWKNGIAERRGVAQIYKSALDIIVDPKPQIKPILLG